MANIDMVGLKNALNSVYNLLNTVESMGGSPNNLDMPLRECFRMEMIRQSLYFAATDGKIKPEERDFINEVFGLNGTTQDFIRIINENNIYSTEFENKGLITLDILRAFDEKYGHMVGVNSVSLALEFMESVMKALLVVDDDLDGNEKEEFYNYYGKLKRRYLTAQTEFIKKGNDVSDNSLKGYYLKKKK